jgi:hypothetical protein
MKTRVLSIIGAVCLLLGGSPAAWSVSRTLTTLCTVSGDTSNADDLTRGIYLTGYPGNNLSLVELAYVVSNGHAGTYLISLTARRGAFNGPIIGSTQTISVDIGDIAGGVYSFPFFDFGGAPVTPGDTIAFTHSYEQLSGTSGGTVYFNVGGGSCPGVFETNDTTHYPLDNPPRRDSAAILTNELNLSTSCIPSDTVMCIDDLPGDHRFKVTVSFHTVQGGGIAGSGQEIPLAQLGVIHGGLFWFFGADNPEMVVKMVDGCSVNGFFWVFISAGTNVGYTVTVKDTVFGSIKTYTNNDLTPAAPVQDTAAISGCV